MVAIGSIVGVALAIWTENKHASLYVEFPIGDDNPSIKYQMFVPVKDSGEFCSATTSAYTRVAGSFSVENNNYSYTLTNPSEINAIVGYALVGWYGGIAIDKLQVPDTHTMQLNGQSVTKPVVRIMADKDYQDYAFYGENTTIEKIVVGSNVSEIDAGFFYGMAFLSTVTIEQSEEAGEYNYIYLKEYAFGGCVKLSSIYNYRPVTDEWDNSIAFYDSSEIWFIDINAYYLIGSFGGGMTDEWTIAQSSTVLNEMVYSGNVAQKDNVYLTTGDTLKVCKGNGDILTCISESTDNFTNENGQITIDSTGSYLIAVKYINDNYIFTVTYKG